jgi:hypothetical protein
VRKNCKTNPRWWIKLKFSISVAILESLKNRQTYIQNFSQENFGIFQLLSLPRQNFIKSFSEKILEQISKFSKSKSVDSSTDQQGIFIQNFSFYPDELRFFLTFVKKKNLMR